MRFDHFTVTLLELRDDAPQLDGDAASELQSAHLAHLADLHDRGILVAAGPLVGPDDRVLRGMSIYGAAPHEVERILAEHPDPAVTAGRFRVRVIPWMVPAGAVQSGEATFPRSVQEARAD